MASSPSDQGLITAWRMSANKLLEIVGEVTRLFAELNMYGYDSLARAAAGAAGNGNGGQAQQPRHVPIELPPPIPPPPSQVSRLIHGLLNRLYHGLRMPLKSFFIEIQNFWAYADGGTAYCPHFQIVPISSLVPIYQNHSSKKLSPFTRF